MCLAMIKSFIASLLVGIFFVSSPLTADIEQISSLKILEDQIEKLDTETLVVFDVDEVLFTDRDAILKPVGDPLKCQIFNEYYTKAKADHEKKQVSETLSLPLKLAQKELVESSIPQIIQRLQKRSIRVIALTSCPTKPFGVIKDFEAWRLNHINEFGIDFSQAFPCYHRFILEKLYSNYTLPPVYHQGVLFAGDFPKAEVLSAFLDTVSFKPKKIIFIDNMYCHLQQMQTKLKQLNIPYKGYYYVKVQKDSENDLNEEIARFQFEYLFQTKKWLSDQEAAELLKMTHASKEDLVCR